jgi:micrococcal nuclease
LKALGLAKVAYLFDDYKYTDLFKSGEAIAQNAQINIWSMPGYDNQEMVLT